MPQRLQVARVVSRRFRPPRRTMIELHGRPRPPWDNQKLGDLTARDGTPFLTIGIHELEGEFVTRKPFVVLDPGRRTRRPRACPKLSGRSSRWPASSAGRCFLN